MLALPLVIPTPIDWAYTAALAAVFVIPAAFWFGFVFLATELLWLAIAVAAFSAFGAFVAWCLVSGGDE